MPPKTCIAPCATSRAARDDLRLRDRRRRARVRRRPRRARRPRTAPSTTSSPGARTCRRAGAAAPGSCRSCGRTGGARRRSAQRVVEHPARGADGLGRGEQRRRSPQPVERARDVAPVERVGRDAGEASTALQRDGRVERRLRPRSTPRRRAARARAPARRPRRDARRARRPLGVLDRDLVRRQRRPPRSAVADAVERPAARRARAARPRRGRRRAPTSADGSTA